MPVDDNASNGKPLMDHLLNLVNCNNSSNTLDCLRSVNVSFVFIIRPIP
jgi:hypothetical protein